MSGMGIEKPQVADLPRVADRITFLYLERCKISRQDGALLVVEERGRVLVPAATIGVLMLGPGTDISHRAMELAGVVGMAVIWVGEQGVRYYAGGHPLSHTSSLLVQQAKLVSNERLRLGVARAMYGLRFPGEDVSTLSMQVLRGREGARIRSTYLGESKRTGVPWNRRVYDPDNYEAGDPVNQALSAGHACLYGLAHSVVVALGLSPGLGFIHTGHERSFIYDLADLYKAEITIPLAFDVAAEFTEDIGNIMRRRTRDKMVEARLLERMTKDIVYLLKGEIGDFEVDKVELWDRHGDVASGVMYEETP